MLEMMQVPMFSLYKAGFVLLCAVGIHVRPALPSPPVPPSHSLCPLRSCCGRR